MDEINLFTYENWRDVVGYEGLYQVSTHGRVRSYDRLVKGKCGSMQLRKGRILRPGLNRYGYQQVNLCKDGKAKMYQVHRLVANAFVPNPNNLPQVNHINECKTDNRAENLEWCTSEYNNNYGTHNERVAKSNTNGKCSKRVAQIDKKTNEIIRIWSSTAECGRYGYNQGHVAACCRGECKTHKGFKWQYLDDSFFSLHNCSGIDFPNLDEEVII